LRKNEDAACAHTEDALASAEEAWQIETTLRNLRLIRQAREDRDEIIGWLTDIMKALEAKAADLRPNEE
jgi:hypothetical protein